MIRILFYLVLLALAAYGVDWLLQRPGHIEVTFAGYHIVTSAAVGFALIALCAIALVVVWSLLRLIFGLPSFVMLASRQRRREKGYAALSRGLIAAGAGDAQGATRASLTASRHLRDDPLALVLQAQAAGLSGDGPRAEAAYGALAQRDDTRILGLRGLHDAAARRGDDEAARHFAEEAHSSAPSPWSAQSVLAQRAAQGDWEQALATVETSVAAKLVDRETGERQRAVLETAIALDKEAVAPDVALALARSAMKRAPDLVPAIVLVARLHTRRGDIRKAAKVIEASWPRCSHPDLARAYLDVRPGDSTSDRLARAQTLMRIASFDPLSRLTVARTALAAKDFETARAAMAPLVAEGQRPSVRTCLVMADLEDAESGDQGQWREWLARASRAPLDAAWIADGIVYDQWQPVSPTTGRLDAFVWQAPADRLGPAMEAIPAPMPRADLVEAPSESRAAFLRPSDVQPAAIAYREPPPPEPAALEFDGARSADPEPVPATIVDDAVAGEPQALLPEPQPDRSRRPFMRARPAEPPAPTRPAPPIAAAVPHHEDAATQG